MFTDIVGYTSLAQRDEATALSLQREQEELVRPLLAGHGGRKVKSTGDGLLVEFESALEAAQCAVEIQRRLYERNAARGSAPLRVRIGIHLGDVVREGSDIFGDAVNIASRVEPVAEPGGVCLTAQVFDQIQHKVPFRLERLEPQTLKGIREPIPVYRVVLPWTEGEPGGHRALAPRLAVLPLVNISPDPKDEYFADGLTEELISVLSQIRGLGVIARTSVIQYKSVPKPVSQVGAELDVSSILEGSVRKVGTQLRITLQLIDVPSQEHTWSESYNRELQDVFALQAEIAEKTAKALRLELLKSEREAMGRPPTRNLEAYKSYLQAVHALDALDYDKAIRFGEEAIRLDPAFALAYSYLANVLIGMFGQQRSRSEVLPRAQELIARALELDPDSSGAHSARGNFALQFERNWELAESELRTAIRINPNDSGAHFWYGLLLKTIQRYDEGIIELKKALQLIPLSLATRVQLASTLELRGDFDAAEEEARQLVGLSPAYGHAMLSMIYLSTGMRERAKDEALVGLEALENDPTLKDNAPYIRAMAKARVFGSTEEAQAIVTQWKADRGTSYFPLAERAGLHVAIGEADEALRLLEQDSREGDQTLWFFYQDDVFDPLRENPRFVAMLKSMNLPTAAPKHQATRA